MGQTQANSHDELIADRLSELKRQYLTVVKAEQETYPTRPSIRKRRQSVNQMDISTHRHSAAKQVPKLFRDLLFCLSFPLSLPSRIPKPSSSPLSSLNLISCISFRQRSEKRLLLMTAADERSTQSVYETNYMARSSNMSLSTSKQTDHSNHNWDKGVDRAQEHSGVRASQKREIEQ